MSIPQHEARQSPALIQHDRPDQHRQPTRHETLGLASVAMAILPAAFWASVAWFVWGWLGAAIAAIVVLVVSIFTMGLLRSANEIETPYAAPWPPKLRLAA